MAKGKRISVYFDRSKQEFVGIDEKLIKEFSEAYPHVNVSAELKKMSLWLRSEKGIRRKGNLGFITNWLGQAVPSSMPVKEEAFLEKDTPLRPEINVYLKGLWKGREHILEMNKRKS